MQIYNDKAILLEASNPQQLANLIPKSKLVGNRVAVHWGLEETMVLRNLGYDVPSPIEKRYKWPTSFTPYDHQIQTASFLTLNKRAYLLSEQGCVDSETEYLSPKGWVKISEYKSGKVAQYTPHGDVEFVEPNEYVKLPCTDMVHIKTKYGLDQMLSPEHRVLLKHGKSSKEKYETVSAEELKRRHDNYHIGIRGNTLREEIAFSSSTIPTAFCLSTTTHMPYCDDTLRLLVAVIADGYFGSRTDWCVIRLKKQRKVERLLNLLNVLNIPYTHKPCKPEGFTITKFNAPERWEVFGEEFWEASYQQLKIIADESLLWDGCTTRGRRFSTTSRPCADFIQYAFCSTGRTARVCVNVRAGKGTEYVVQVRDNQNLYLRGSDKTITPCKSTDGYKYCFEVPSTYLVFRRNGCVFLSGNTGKTASAIWAADYLMKQGKINRVLVVCPMSIMEAAWKDDLFKFAMHRTAEIAHGVKAKRVKVLNLKTDFVIINYEGIQIIRDEIAAGGFDLVVVDEANAYKNPQTDRWKTLNSLLRPDTWLWMMTGTPAAQNPVDAYGLAKMMNPNSVPRYFGRFRDMVMTKISQFKWVPKQDARDTVHKILQPAIRFTKDECLDLPEIIITRRDVESTPQQNKYYKILKNKMVMQASGEEVTARNAAIQIAKLMQISLGAVYTDNGEILQFDVTPRYKALREIIDEANKKVIVFVPYKNVIDLVVEKLRADKISTEIISGDVSASKRSELFRKFQNEDDPRVFVIQPQSAAHGVTLTAADTIVWWGPTPSLETYLQANARIHRPGQDSKCTIVQLRGSYVERRYYDMLDTRIDFHSGLLDLYKEILE